MKPYLIDLIQKADPYCWKRMSGMQKVRTRELIAKLDQHIGHIRWQQKPRFGNVYDVSSRIQVSVEEDMFSNDVILTVLHSDTGEEYVAATVGIRGKVNVMRWDTLGLVTGG